MIDEETAYIEIRRVLRQTREAAGLSATEVARRMGYESCRMVYNIENRKKEVPLSLVYRYVAALGKTARLVVE